MSEERPAPKTKEQLITMLKEQLDKVQDEISAMQNTLEEEREKRKELTAELEQKQQKVQELIENQTKMLGDKVHEGLYNTLETANKIRADAQAQIRKIAEDNTILNEKITHKDNKVNEERKSIDLNQRKVSVLEQKKIDLQRKQASLIDKKEEMKKKYDLMKNEYQRIEKQQQELRNNIENAKKLRMYLNKHLESTLKASSNVPHTKRNSIPGNDSFWNG